VLHSKKENFDQEKRWSFGRLCSHLSQQNKTEIHEMSNEISKKKSRAKKSSLAVYVRIRSAALLQATFSTKHTRPKIGKTTPAQEKRSTCSFSTGHKLVLWHRVGCEGVEVGRRREERRDGGGEKRVLEESSEPHVRKGAESSVGYRLRPFHRTRPTKVLSLRCYRKEGGTLIET